MRLIDADYLIDLIESKTDLEFDEITEKELVRMIREQPTLDETEIIRKPFERVVERLEEYWKSHKALEDYEMFNGTYIEMKQQEMVVKAYEKAIEIVKKECGISE